MDKNELIRRIDGISYERIPDMDEFSVKMLTDDFKEPLVRRLISKAPARNQKWALEWIERKYRDCNTWNPTPPSYFQTLRFDIDCGIPITSNDDASTVTHVIQSGETKVNVVVQSQTKDQQTLIAKLRKENAELKEKHTQQPVSTNKKENAEQAQTIQELQNEIASLKEKIASNKSDEHFKTELNRIKEIHENTLVALLKPAFYNIEDDARDFLDAFKDSTTKV